MVERHARRGLNSARARILAACAGLLLVSAVLAVAGARQLVVDRTSEHVDDTLDAHIERFQDYVQHAPTGRRDARRLAAILDAYLDRVHTHEDEAFIAFVGGRHHRTASQSEPPRELLSRLGRLAGGPRLVSGEVDVPEGTAHYELAPIRLGRQARGALAVALRLDGDEVTAPLRLGVVLIAAWLLLALGITFAVLWRVLAPLDDLSEAARATRESGVMRRVRVTGQGEVADLARTFNSMLDRLESTFEAQGDFLSDAGHDLRTPITIIRGHLELLPNEPEERRRTVALVLDELDRMSRLVNDLLVIARAGHPGFLRVEPLDLQDLAHELYAKATALAPREWRLVEATPGRMVADRQRVTEAVMNLAENAVHHTHEDDVIELGAVLEDRSARIWVRDGGPGIAPADQERIFDRFARSRDGARGPRDGAGLGLAIVRAIAEAHGGGVTVQSTPGLGATFEIVLPVEPIEPVEEAGGG